MGEYAKSPVLVVAGRGDRNVIATFPGEPIHNNYEGNLADICPVGALTLKEFRFKSRVWDLHSTESVCTGCDRNCSILLETKRNRLFRARPRVNLQVNGHFMCDVGRFGLLDHCNPQGREELGWVKGARKPASDAASELAATLAAESRRWVIVLSARLTAEEILLAKLVLSPLAKALCFVPAAAEGGDAILYTGRRAANQKALELLGVAAKKLEEVGALLAEPTTAGLLCFDAELGQKLVASAKPKRLALVDVWRAPPAADATIPPTTAPLGAELFVPGTLYSEKSGTFVNLDSVLQRAERAQRPPQGAVYESDLLRAIAAKAAVSLSDLSGKPDVTWALLETLGRPGATLNQIPEDGIALAAAAPLNAGLKAGLGAEAAKP
jgi:NADH-quinone oxidoreductase subunit G